MHVASAPMRKLPDMYSQLLLLPGLTHARAHQTCAQSNRPAASTATTASSAVTALHVRDVISHLPASLTQEHINRAALAPTRVCATWQLPNASQPLHRHCRSLLVSRTPRMSAGVSRNPTHNTKPNRRTHLTQPHTHTTSHTTDCTCTHTPWAREACKPT